MKKLIFAALAVVVMTGVAEESRRVIKKTLTPEELAARKEIMMTKTGGMLHKPGVGAVTFINCQTKIPAEEVDAAVKKFGSLLKVNVKIEKADAWKIPTALPEGANAAVYIANDASLPMSLVAVEARWGMMNVATLESGARFSKELTRIITLTVGGGVVPNKASPMKSVAKAADLDKLKTDGFAMETVTSMQENMKALGITTGKVSTYLKACQEGWAPAPTNSYQKAIWDQVHELPTNPIKIKFDPKQGK